MAPPTPAVIPIHPRKSSTDPDDANTTPSGPRGERPRGERDYSREAPTGTSVSYAVRRPGRRRRRTSPRDR